MLASKGSLAGASSRGACNTRATAKKVAAVRAVTAGSRRHVVVVKAYQPPGNPINGAPEAARRLSPPTAPGIFGNIETMIARTLNSTTPGQRLDWEEVEGNWVLRPPNGAEPEAIVHFLGGAFVGAAPQLSYRLLLEALASRNVLVITTPYGTCFDHLRIADEVQYKFDRGMKALQTEVGRLPVYGVGHSLGSLVHMLISARYNAKVARLLGPLLAQLAASPIRPTVEAATDALKGLSPSLVRQVAPLMEQLTPIYMDVAQGRKEFSPSPDETQNLIKNYYGVPRNLLLRFKDDTIDETIDLASLLQSSGGLSSRLDISVRTLPGDHIKPMTQAIVDLPPEVARVANRAVEASGGLIGRLADMAGQMGVQQAGSLEELSRNVSGMSSMFGGQIGGPVKDGMQALADEVAAWMGVDDVVVKGGRALPAHSVSRPQSRADMGESA